MMLSILEQCATIITTAVTAAGVFVVWRQLKQQNRQLRCRILTDLHRIAENDGLP